MLPKNENSNLHRFGLHRPSIKGTKLLFQVIKATIKIGGEKKKEGSSSYRPASVLAAFVIVLRASNVSEGLTWILWLQLSRYHEQKLQQEQHLDWSKRMCIEENQQIMEPLFARIFSDLISQYGVVYPIFFWSWPRV